MSNLSFSSITLKPDLLTNLETLGYTEMTPVQSGSLPPILEGRDVIGQGKTGSGKTAAFALGVLQTLDVKLFKVQSLVVCPTRELADQVSSEIRRLARGINNIKVLTICGGTPFGPQVGSLESGVHIVVGTPGRIEDHLRRGTLKVDSVQTLVLDEADRMLDMGFQPSIDAIIEQLPEKRQTLLFSATYPDKIEAIASRIMQRPVLVKVESKHDQNTISQHFYRVSNKSARMTALRKLLLHFMPESTLVFCNTKTDTQDVADELTSYGFNVLALNGDLEQRERDQTLVRFSNKSASILVATDVAARGLDIDALDAVINFDIAHDPEVHTHRIGRTGRAGSKGIAYSLFSESEVHKVAMLELDSDALMGSDELPPDNVLDKPAFTAPMATLLISGGKKQKLRPGDILGALTGENGIAGDKVGKIKIACNWSFVAVARDSVNSALQKLGKDKLKGRSFKVKHLRR